MISNELLKSWFRREVIPLQQSLTAFIRRASRSSEDVLDLRQEIYERALLGAREALPVHTRAYLYKIARNHILNAARRHRIVSIDLYNDLENAVPVADLLVSERHLSAREELRRAEAGLARLPDRCREVVRLRKIEGHSTREVAEQLGVTTHTVEKHLSEGMRALADHMLGGSGRIARPLRLRRKGGDR